MKEQIDKIKKHIKDHKEVYITGSVCVVVGSISYIVGKNNGFRLGNQNTLETIGDYDQNVTNVVCWKPTSILEQITVIELPARGHRGFMIVNEKTGELWGSLVSAAKDIGCSPGVLRDHLNGLRDNIDGNTYKNLGENLNEKVEIAA